MNGLKKKKRTLVNKTIFILEMINKLQCPLFQRPSKWIYHLSNNKQQISENLKFGLYLQRKKHATNRADGELLYIYFPNLLT